jgi:hypothetical protein
MRTLDSIIAGQHWNISGTTWKQYRAIIADRPGPTRATNRAGKEKKCETGRPAKGRPVERGRAGAGCSSTSGWSVDGRHRPDVIACPRPYDSSCPGQYLSCMHAPAEASGAADRASIAARPAEYEAATQRWMQQTVQHIMRARDRLYAQLRTETAETVPAYQARPRRRTGARRLPVPHPR